MDFADAVIADRLGAFTRALDANGSGGQLLLISGSKAAVKGSSLNGGNVVLAILQFPKPSFSAISGNTITLATPTGGVVASGIATWARYLDGAGNFVADAVVSQPPGTAGPPVNGIAHGTGDVWLDDPQLWLGGAVSVISGTLSEA